MLTCWTWGCPILGQTQDLSPTRDQPAQGNEARRPLLQNWRWKWTFSWVPRRIIWKTILTRSLFPRMEKCAQLSYQRADLRGKSSRKSFCDVWCLKYLNAAKTDFKKVVITLWNQVFCIPSLWCQTRSQRLYFLPPSCLSIEKPAWKKNIRKPSSLSAEFIATNLCGMLLNFSYLSTNTAKVNRHNRWNGTELINYFEGHQLIIGNVQLFTKRQINVNVHLHALKTFDALLFGQPITPL